MKRHHLKLLRIQSLTVVMLLLWQLDTVSFSLDISTGPNGTNVQVIHDLGYTGQNVSVGLISADYSRYTHEAFAGNALWYDATGQNPYNPSDFDPQNHDTPLGGIICSRGGNFNPNNIGVAPGAFLYSVKVSNNGSISTVYITDALDYLRSQQCQVVVTGIQLISSDPDLQPDGNNLFSLIYDYYAYEYNLVFATASGNGSSAITIFGDTFNSITTGGLLLDVNNVYYQVGSTSNSGTTSDGRQKPDVAAPSQNQRTCLAGSDVSWGNASPSSSGQTSWAVPHTGGVAAVLLSYANTTTNTDDDQNEVIKAVIVNSAFPNIRDKSGNSTTFQTWNEDRGYGRIDGLRAFEILGSPGISTTQSKGWAYDFVSYGQSNSYIVEGIENERLLVTLAWNRRVEWDDQKFVIHPGYGVIEEGELSAFLANLDIEIYDPDGVLISPVPSTIDNLEKVDLLLTKTGQYEIRITNQSSSESADYAAAFELLEPLSADFNIDYIVNDSDLMELVTHWLDANCMNDAQPCFDFNLSFDDSINFGDFSIFSAQWLSYDPRYYSP